VALNAQKDVISHWQFDVLALDNYTAVTGLIFSSFTVTISQNAVDDTGSWTVVDGTGVLDSAIVAATIYIDEVGDGRYRLRWIPPGVGIWTIRLREAGVPRLIEEDFQTTLNTIDDPGLNYSFIPPGT
jgi:hypothetical protein